MRDFKFSCPTCGQSLEGSDELLGLTVECPSCNGKITLPKPVSAVPQHQTQPIPSTSDLLQTAVTWYKTRPLYLRILIAFLGWPITLCILVFLLPFKWPRRLLVFLLIEGTLIALFIAMRDELAATASSPIEFWGPLVLNRLLFLGLLPAWLVHRAVKKVRQAYSLPPGGVTDGLPIIIFFFPGIGLSIYANWRYELYLNRKRGNQES